MAPLEQLPCRVLLPLAAQLWKMLCYYLWLPTTAVHQIYKADARQALAAELKYNVRTGREVTCFLLFWLESSNHMYRRR